MYIKSLLVTFILLSTLNLQAQVNFDKFIEDIANQSRILLNEESKNITKFMKYGYRKMPNLRTNDIQKIPVYCIYSDKQYFNQKRTKDSIFYYLKPSSLQIENIFFYRDGRYILVAYRNYSNVRDQPIGEGSILTKKIAEIVFEEKPDIIFTIPGTSHVYLFFKDEMLYCYAPSKDKKTFDKILIKDYVNSLDDSDIYWMTNIYKPETSIYSK